MSYCSVFILDLLLISLKDFLVLPRNMNWVLFILMFELRFLGFFLGSFLCLGWSNHFLSKRKYHLIIPADDEWNKPLVDDVMDLQTHLLHGLIHCNGFGHLLCINGIEGGSKYLCGREIMDLWDRICTNLQTR